MNRVTKLLTRIVIALAIVFVFFKLFFVEVNMVNHGVITRFGKITKVVVSKNADEVRQVIDDNGRYEDVKVIEKSGLVFKLLLIEAITKYDNRLLTYDTAPREVMTLDKKKIILDNNAQWKIVNPLLFKVSMSTVSKAHTRIDDLMYSKINEKVGKTLAHDLISKKEVVAKMTEEIATELNEALLSYGLQIVDVQVKRTNYPAENNENIFTRMNAERAQKATEYRSKGESEAKIITSTAEKEASILLADAKLSAEKIKGEADAKATKIYNEAYSKDPEFYEFYRTLQTYKTVLDDNTKMVIDSDSPFAKYLFGK